MRQSPLFNLPSDGPPLLISCGGAESDEFHRQAAAYCEAWRNNGLRAEMFIQADKDHFGAIDGFSDPNSPLCRKISEFIKQDGGDSGSV
jgi:arylformamidase